MKDTSNFTKCLIILLGVNYFLINFLINFTSGEKQLSLFIKYCTETRSTLQHLTHTYSDRSPHNNTPNNFCLVGNSFFRFVFIRGGVLHNGCKKWCSFWNILLPFRWIYLNKNVQNVATLSSLDTHDWMNNYTNYTMDALNIISDWQEQQFLLQLIKDKLLLSNYSITYV